MRSRRIPPHPGVQDILAGFKGALELLRELREQGVLSEGEFIARRGALVTAGENRE